MVRPERLELPTLWFEAKCSIRLSYGRTPCNRHNQNSGLQDARESPGGVTPRGTILGATRRSLPFESQLAALPADDLLEQPLVQNDLGGGLQNQVVVVLEAAGSRTNFRTADA